MSPVDRNGRWARLLCIGSHVSFVLFTLFWSVATAHSFSTMGLVAFLMGVSAWSLLQAAYFMRVTPNAEQAKTAG